VRRLGDLSLVRPRGEATREHRRDDRLEVCLPSQRWVKGLEAPCGTQQQRRRVAAALVRERDLGAQPLQPRPLERVERPQLGGSQEVGG
jgi:hypothetical protein